MPTRTPTRPLRMFQAWFKALRQASLFDDAEPAAVDAGVPVAAGPGAKRAPRDVEGPRPPGPLAPLAHPQANRHTQLAGRMVHYALTRARRRSIGMMVGLEGLSVRAPRWTTLAEIEAALQERATWIIKHLQAQADRAALAQAHKLVWQDGMEILYLGKPLRVVLDPSLDPTQDPPLARPRRAPKRQRQGVSCHLDDGPSIHPTLRVGLPSSTHGDALRVAVLAWLQQSVRRVFEQRCAHFAPQLGVQVGRLSLSAARTRWGSAGSDGSVRLNWRLVHHPIGSIDYVVVHELAHLRHMNHGPDFWRLVAAVLPDFEQAKQALKQDGPGLHGD